MRMGTTGENLICSSYGKKQHQQLIFYGNMDQKFDYNYTTSFDYDYTTSEMLLWTKSTNQLNTPFMIIIEP